MVSQSVAERDILTAFSASSLVLNKQGLQRTVQVPWSRGP